MIALGIFGWREYCRLAEASGAASDATAVSIGSLSILIFAMVASEGWGETGLLVAVASAMVLPVLANLRSRSLRSFGTFQSAAYGALYLGIPVYSAIHLRGLPGEVNRNWFNEFAHTFGRVGSAMPYGLALVLTVVLAVWLCDTAAYLAGSAVGRNNLAPHISPGKTIEGSITGLVAAILTGAVAFIAFGAGTWHFGAVLGAAVGVSGQIGDLAESLMKRQAGVKDSGTLIPGHGGVLDRIDALLFALPTALLTMQALNWLHR